MFSAERDFSQWELSGFNGAEAKLFQTIDSTHSQMKAQASAGLIAPGTLFVANQQQAGRGRHERTWESPAGLNLYFNILIPLDGIPLSKAPQITQVAALTFAEIFRALQDDATATGWTNAANNTTVAPTVAAATQPDLTSAAHQTATMAVGTPRADLGPVTVKWPNDILCGKSKFCGILAEIAYLPNGATGRTSESRPQQPPRPAVNMGVGINVNSDSTQYAFLNRAVTTLKEITGRTINREKLMRALVGNLERAVGQFRAFGIAPWVEAWRKMDKFIGARGTIIVNNHCTDSNRDSGAGSIKKSGRILDMQPDGSLLFQTDDGAVETVYSADLEI